MKNHTHHPFTRILNNQKGVSAILVAILLPVLIGFAALAIDVGYMYTTKNELQNIADAAALAGAGELGRIYINEVDPSNHGTHILTTPQEGQIQNAVDDVADWNKHDDEDAFVINPDDISIGVWNWNLKQLDPPDPGNGKAADAVQVTARRDAAFNGRVATFFARIFGGNQDTFESGAVATAALSGPASVTEGALTTPFGISYAVFDDNCPDAVTFNSAHDNLVCTAWHNFFDPINPPSSTDALDQSEKMLSFINADANGPAWLGEHFNGLGDVDDQTSPPVSIGDLFNFTWGVGSLIGNPSARNTLYFDQTIYNPDSGPDSLYNTYYTAGNPVPDANSDDFYSRSNRRNPNPMSTAFNYWRFNDGDDDNSTWAATIPVYGSECNTSVNASNPETIVGFADIFVIAVHGPPSSSIDVIIDCTMKVIEGRSGGGNFGNLKGSIPNLVE